MTYPIALHHQNSVIVLVAHVTSQGHRISIGCFIFWVIPHRCIPIDSHRKPFAYLSHSCARSEFKFVVLARVFTVHQVMSSSRPESTIDRSSIRIMPCIIPNHVRVFGYDEREDIVPNTTKIERHVAKKKISKVATRVKKWRSNEQNRTKEADRQRERRRLRRESMTLDERRNVSESRKKQRLRKRAAVNEESDSSSILKFPDSEIFSSVMPSVAASRSSIQWQYHVEKVVERFERTTYIHQLNPVSRTAVATGAILKLSSPSPNQNRTLLFVRNQ